MNSTKLSAFCDKVLEIGWLLAVIITPLFFNVYSSRVFEPDKLTTLRTVAVIMAAVWVIKLIEERTSGRHEVGLTWRTPLVFPTLFMVVVYLLSTLLSVTRWVSLLGSYQRLQGTYTTLAYVVMFLVILQGLRTRAQLDRLITVIVLNSLPIALYGLVQRNRLDPLPWGGDVTRRVASNMGNPIFVAAYLIMIFPLAVGRIAESFKAILTEEESDWADIPRAAGYIFIAAVDLIAIWYAQSRGPLLGLIAASFFLFLLLATSSRTKWGAASVLAIVTATTLVVGFLVIVNIPGGPLQSLQRAPWLGRLGEVFDFEHGTGKVRALIWEGMVDLILPHEPIQYPDGHYDAFNVIRPLVGYGPESIYVAYNRFYPPLLGHYESRTASPDRSHNETLDSLAITGLLGLIAYLWVFGSVFYYSFKWLGLVKDQRQRNLLFGLMAGLAAASIAFFWWWQGLHFFGAALTLGIASGLGVYLAIMATISAVHLLRSNEAALPPPLHPHHFLLISLVAAVMAHFVEINFGIAIASTRTTFWAYAGILVVAGLNLICEREAELQRAEAGSREQEAGGRDQLSKRRRKRRKVAPPSSAQSTLPAWLGPTLAIATVGGFILGTLTFNFITNAERLFQPLAIVWRALTILPAQGSRTSYGALMIFALTWLMSAVVFISEMAKGGAFSERRGDGTLATFLYLLISLTVGFGLALVLAGRQASLMHIQPQTLEGVIGIADRVASLLTRYYGFIILVLIAGGVALFLGTHRLPRRTAHPWGTLALVVLTVLAIAIAVVTNLRPIQADIVYKQADPYDRQGQWQLAVEHYKHAIELASKEDFYYLYLGRAYLEYASVLEDPAVRNVMLRETEQTLTEARKINPLNTDHSANLARMYRRWADFASDDETRHEMLQRASENYAIATSLSPQNAILWNEWAVLLYYGLGDVAGYERTLQRSLDIDAEFDQTWLMCGDMNRSSGRLEEAAHCYEEALELNPDAPQVWIVLGDTYRQGGRPEEALNCYEEALKLDPNAPVWRMLGDTYIALQRWEQAIAALTQVLELEPDAEDIWNVHQVLARLYSQVGQQGQALAHASTALQLAPEDQQAALQDLVAQLQLLETQQP
jgi:tetratricopeptide (TPR) repeat protein